MLNQPLFAALDVSLETTTICLRRTDMPPTRFRTREEHHLCQRPGPPRKVGLQTDLAKPRAVIVASMPSSMMKHPNCNSMCPLRIARGVARCSSRPLLFALAAGMSTWHLRT